jgi:hypothetical protein
MDDRRKLRELTTTKPYHRRNTMNVTTWPVPFQIARQRLSAWKWRTKYSAQHARRAWRYLTHSLTSDDASMIAYEMQDISGDWPLASLSLDSVMEAARDRWEDHPELRSIAEDACSRVASKWSGGGEESVGAAEDWALDKIAEYAERDGVELVLTEAWRE